MPRPSPSQTTAKKRNTIRYRWFLTVLGLVSVFAVISTVASLRIGLWGAGVGTREWLSSNHIESLTGYNDLIYERLEREAFALQRSTEVASALDAGDLPAIEAAIARVWPQRADAWLVLTRDGRVMSDIAACRSEVIAAELPRSPRHIVLCGDAPLLVASSPAHADSLPRIFVARRLDDRYIDGLRWVAKTEVALLSPTGYLGSSARNLAGERVPLGLSEAAIAEAFRAEEPHFGTDELHIPSFYGGYVLGSGDRHIAVGETVVPSFYLSAPLHDDEGVVPVRVIYAVPRFVMEQGPLYSAGGLAAISTLLVLLLGLLGWRLAVRFTEPLHALTKTAARVAKGELDARVEVAGGGELETLGETFNGMVERLGAAMARDKERTREVVARSAELESALHELERAHGELRETQQQLIDASRRAGMADMAAGVLHNIGNVLNSVNVSASLVADGLRKSKVPRVQQAMKLLERPSEELARYVSEDPKGKQVLPFLSELGRHVADERVQILAEVDTLCRHIDHAKSVVAMQQSYAGMGGMVERCVPAAVIEDALRLSLSSGIAAKIAIERRLDADGEVLLDRHKLVQILVNLIRNAAQAVEALDQPRIVVRASLEGDQLVVAVEDNGVGIAEDNLTRIFRHGFTTKKDGHGFGLHSSALAATEMGGALGCESDGEGRGARFRLVVPAAPASARCA